MVQPVMNIHIPKLHIYYAESKSSTVDCRYFIRILARPQKLKNSTDENMREETIEYLISLGDRVLGEALDALEIAMAERPNADGN